MRRRRRRVLALRLRALVLNACRRSGALAALRWCIAPLGTAYRVAWLASAAAFSCIGQGRVVQPVQAVQPVQQQARGTGAGYLPARPRPARLSTDPAIPTGTHYSAQGTTTTGHYQEQFEPPIRGRGTGSHTRPAARYETEWNSVTCPSKSPAVVKAVSIVLSGVTT